MSKCDTKMMQSKVSHGLRLLPILTIIVLSFIVIRPLAASPGKLTWDIAKTPSIEGKVVISPSEINALAMGPDGKTFYAIDIPNSKIYKTTNGGITWQDFITRSLFIDAGATPPAWDIAVAPDDPNFVAVVTNNRTKVYLSINGGATWIDSNLNLTGSLIADITISVGYGTSRDVAIGTRNPDGLTNGDVWAWRYPGFGGWKAQNLGRDVTSLNFSPNYFSDFAILAVASTTAATFLHIGKRDVYSNTTTWDTSAGLTGYPVSLDTISESQIITSDIELPSDCNSDDPKLRQIYVSYDFFDGTTRQGKVCRVDDTLVYVLKAVTGNGIASISYYGSIGSSKLLAAEAKANAGTAQVNIWRTFNPAATPPTWQLPTKHPTGGGGSAYANAQVAWSPDGTKAYCGTATGSIETASDWANMALPVGPWSGAIWDESAFSVSLDNANTWNQISLIDTGLVDPNTPPTNKLFLTDVAVTANSKTLYLASVNENSNYFDSIWRSTSDPLGETWERVWCAQLVDPPATNAADNPVILRLNPRNPETKVIFAAVKGGQEVYCSSDQGQIWSRVNPGATVFDISLAGDDIVYILDDIFVYRGKFTGSSWQWQPKVGTCLTSGHTIATPLKSPKDEEWVIVGDANEGKVAYANFLAKTIQFEQTRPVPVPGKIHVLCDDKFDENKIIYAASGNINGKIYRWDIGTSNLWEELKPPNSNFYGLAQQHGVLYSAWVSVPNTGVDRTLYPTARIPPPLEWDSLTTGLNPNVVFHCEPSSLKTSANTDVYLWAIDNRNYNFSAQQGCLWTYTDMLATVGPWALAPALGEVIPIDPVTGRAAQINFKWRDYPYAIEYELWVAKDDQFSSTFIRTIVAPAIVDAPAWILLPGTLEAGHTYYWKVRATRAATGEDIISPWSTTMFFTVMPGLSVTTPYIGPMLLAPRDGTTGVPINPVSFSWTRFKDTDEYQFQLAKDSAMTKLLVDTKVATTAYGYHQRLDYSRNYYWRVKATKPIVSDWSPVFSFLTEAAPPLPPPAPAKLLPKTPVYVWIVISLFTILFVALIALITARRF